MYSNGVITINMKSYEQMNTIQRPDVYCILIMNDDTVTEYPNLVNDCIKYYSGNCLFLNFEEDLISDDDIQLLYNKLKDKLYEGFVTYDFVCESGKVRSPALVEAFKILLLSKKYGYYTVSYGEVFTDKSLMEKVCNRFTELIKEENNCQKDN